MKFAIVIFLLAGGMAVGQTAQPPGVTSEWDVRKILGSLDQQAQRLRSVIGQVQPEQWVANGAPGTWVAQWKSAQSELQSLLTSSEAFARQPEKLSLALDTYFRMQAMESTLGSVSEGVRKYQNPALGDLIGAVVAENGTNRDRLRQYITDLAAQKEQEFLVVDREVQRCRESLLHAPAANERKPAHK
jgi:hypothetical protein